MCNIQRLKYGHNANWNKYTITVLNTVDNFIIHVKSNILETPEPITET